jgi:hypothetical protein
MLTPVMMGRMSAAVAVMVEMGRERDLILDREMLRRY